MKRLYTFMGTTGPSKSFIDETKVWPLLYCIEWQVNWRSVWAFARFSDQGYRAIAVGPLEVMVS